MCLKIRKASVYRKAQVGLPNRESGTLPRPRWPDVCSTCAASVCRSMYTLCVVCSTPNREASREIHHQKPLPNRQSWGKSSASALYLKWSSSAKCVSAPSASRRRTRTEAFRILFCTKKVFCTLKVKQKSKSYCISASSHLVGILASSEQHCVCSFRSLFTIIFSRAFSARTSQ